MSKKDRYKEYSKTSSLTIFQQPWWLDVTCEGTWNVCLVEHEAQMVAAMPYSIKNRLGFTIISQPRLTQTLGLWLQENGAKYTNRLGHEKDLQNNLIAQLPNFDYFQQNWHYTNTNYLPFYWKGFQQTTRYTYRLANLSDIDQVWSGLRDNIRREIRKAKNRFKLTVRTDLLIDEFIALNIKTFKRQGKKLPYTKSFINNLNTACIANNACKLFIAEDEQGRHHAGVYIVWDKQNAYYLMGGGDPELRASGATSLCMWEAIKFAATVTKGFDFEGSMMEPVERFFRAFGAIQTPYFCITQTPSKIIKAYRCIREIREK